MINLPPIKISLGSDRQSDPVNDFNDPSGRRVKIPGYLPRDGRRNPAKQEVLAGFCRFRSPAALICGP
jgi:hypothetical protein